MEELFSTFKEESMGSFPLEEMTGEDLFLSAGEDGGGGDSTLDEFLSDRNSGGFSPSMMVPFGCAATGSDADPFGMDYQDEYSKLMDEIKQEEEEKMKISVEVLEEESDVSVEVPEEEMKESVDVPEVKVEDVRGFGDLEEDPWMEKEESESNDSNKGEELPSKKQKGKKRGRKPKAEKKGGVKEGSSRKAKGGAAPPKKKGPGRPKGSGVARPRAPATRRPVVRATPPAPEFVVPLVGNELNKKVLKIRAPRRILKPRKFVPEGEKDEEYFENRRKNTEAARRCREQRRVLDEHRVQVIKDLSIQIRVLEAEKANLLQDIQVYKEILANSKFQPEKKRGGAGGSRKRN